jgi:tripartite-type tricarboxylate transporter receptor subunit TctC
VHVALPQVQAGKLVMLAAGGTQRTPVTPEVPSLAEATGVTSIDVDIWYAAYAPAATPAEVVARLNAEWNAQLRLADVRETLGKQGLQPTGGTPEQLAALTRTDLERWARVVQAAHIEAD